MKDGLDSFDCAQRDNEYVGLSNISMTTPLPYTFVRDLFGPVTCRLKKGLERCAMLVLSKLYCLVSNLVVISGLIDFVSFSFSLSGLVPVGIMPCVWGGWNVGGVGVRQARAG